MKVTDLVMETDLVKTTDLVMGIDASLTGSGIVVLDQDGKVVMSDVITSKKEGVRRLIDIDSQVFSLLESFHPRLVILEGYAFSRGSAMARVGELGGVLKKTLFVEGYETLIVPPTSVKKFSADKGNAKKDQVRLAVYKRWGVEFKTNDEVDAYVLARIGLAALGKKEGLTKAQLECLAKVSGLKRSGGEQDE